MIFELAQDFHNVIAAMPREHQRHRMLELLEEAIRRDIHFIARHPMTLFQCMWNTCWWYDCPEAEKHYDKSETGSITTRPWEYGQSNLFHYMEDWRRGKVRRFSFFRWVRMIRPPMLPLGGPLWSVIREHAHSVKNVVYSPDNRFIVTMSREGTMILWDTHTNMKLLGFYNRGPREKLSNCTAFSPNGSQLGFTEPGVVNVWDISRNQLTATFSLNSTDFSWEEAEDIAFSPDGKRLAAVGDFKIRIWSIEDKEKITEFDAFGSKIAFMQDGSLVVCDLFDILSTFEWQWFGSDGRLDRTLKASDFYSTRAVLSRDGTRVASWGWEKDSFVPQIRSWDAATGEELFRATNVDFVNPIRDTFALSLSDDGRFLIWTDLGGKIHVWDIVSKSSVAQLGERVGIVGAVAISPDRLNVACGYDDGTVRIWRIRNTADTAPTGHKRDITSVALSPNGKRFVTGSLDGSLQFWDSSNGVRCRILRSNQRWIRSVAYSPCGRYIASGEGAAASTGYGEGMETRDYLPGDGSIGIHNINTMLNSVKEQEYDSYFGMYLVNNTQETTVKIWDSQNGDELKKMSGTEAWARVVVFSHNSRLVACGVGCGNIILWDVVEECRRLYSVCRTSIESISFSPDGMMLAIGGIDGLIRILDTSDGTKLFSLEADSEVKSLAFSSDSIRLAGVTRKNTILWDLTKKVRVYTIEGRCDPAAVVGGKSSFPLWAIARNQETEIMDVATRQAAAWFPEELRELKIHPRGYTWIGTTGVHLQILKLETI